MLEVRGLDTFLRDLVLLRAVGRSVEIPGEAARRVSRSYEEAHPEIPLAQDHRSAQHPGT